MSNNKKNVNIMDIPFINSTKERFLNHQIRPHLEKQKKCFIVTANPEIVMETRKNKAYKEIVQTADFVVPDGVGIILAAKYKKQALQERIAGFDLMKDMLKMADDTAAKCFFLGSSEETNKEAVENITNSYPQLKVVGRHHGYFGLDDASISSLVEEAKPDFIFVALGYPKQEMWINNNIHKFKKGIFMGVGGSLDVLAGQVKRAPKFWIRLNLEWFYRMIRQPSRWKRILPVFKFMWLIYTRRD